MSLFSFLSKDKNKLQAKPSPTSHFSGLSEDQLLPMILQAEEREWMPRIEFAKGQNVLEFSPRIQSQLHWARPKTPKLLIHFGDKEEGLKSDEGVNPVLGQADNWPFLESSIDILLLRTPLVRMKWTKLLREAHRVLKTGSLLYWTDMHPFSMMVQHEVKQSTVIDEGLMPGLEKYFKMTMDAGFQFHLIKEAFIDGSYKKLFGDSDTILDPYRKSPFLLYLCLKKI